MAVRFLPPPGADREPEPENRGDLAEVIEFRSRLHRSGPVAEEPAQEESVVAPAQHPAGTHLGGDGAGRLERARAVIEGGFGGGLVSVSEAGSQGVSHSQGDADSQGVAEGQCDADGRGVSGEFEAEPEDAEPSRTAEEDGVRMLGRRARSSGELREELSRLGHGVDAVEGVIDEFTRSLYLDDLGLARALTEKLRDTKRASRSQIRVKLRARRLPDDVIETALGELDDDDEYALLRETARQRAAKLGGLERQVAERRLLGFLARRGWSGEPASRAARDALDGAGRGARGGSGVRFQ